MPRHFLTLLDLQREELLALTERAIELKALRGRPEHPRPLAGKSVAVLMEKASTRTRISFEVGIHELGGAPIALVGRDLQLGRNEPLGDTAKVLSRYLSAVVVRTHGHDRLEELAAASEVPFVNALTDSFHPCQLLADLMTIREKRAAGLEDLHVAWVGDGNNMAHSWILAASLLDFRLTLACPEGYRPDEQVLALGRAQKAGQIELCASVEDAVKGAHVVTTDVWASMGQEQEAAARIEAFADYTVTAQHMEQAASDAIFLHCLPAHRGEEVAAEVIDGPASHVWDQAENRLHSQKALLELLLGPQASAPK
ncbi:MAG: ornithine carbamoyltransferase [Myxococcales bacterium]|nr:ornithine carbamoyltransferase [Myxococcales bacterium]